MAFQPALTTEQTVTIKDDATITVSDGGDLSGTAHFQPFSGAGCAAGNELGAVQDVPVSGTSSQTVTTTAITIVSPGDTVYWQVSYTSDVSAHFGHCRRRAAENTVIDINN